MLQRLRRGRLLLIAAPVLLAAATASVGATAGGAEIDGRYQAQGHKLHLECTGTGSPTVVFDSGGGGNTFTWTFIRQSLGKAKVRLCAYDRYGLGQSDLPTELTSRTIEEMAADTHALLANAPVKGPYVFVGYSLGGLIDRYYANAYPRQVAGLVLIDCAPDDWDLFLGTGVFYEGGGMIKIDMSSALASLRASDWVGKRPLVVIEAQNASAASNKAYWDKAQRALAKTSSNSLFFVAKHTDHNIPAETPKLVAQAVQLVVDSARRHKRLPRCKSAKLSGARC